jgi:hypothetical protein
MRREQRLRLRVAGALAAGESVGPALRLGGAHEAAAEAERGALELALRIAGAESEDVALARVWPRAALAARQRLDRIDLLADPGAELRAALVLVFTVSVTGATAGSFGWAKTSTAMAGAAADLAAVMGQGSVPSSLLPILALTTLGLLVVVALLALGYLSLVPQERWPTWGAARARARRLAVAVAAAETGAPPEAVRDLAADDADLALSIARDSAFQEHLDRLTLSATSIVSAVRIGGLSVAALACGTFVLCVVRSLLALGGPQ